MKVLILSWYSLFIGVALFCTALIVNQEGSGWMLVLGIVLVLVSFILLASAKVDKIGLRKKKGE